MKRFAIIFGALLAILLVAVFTIPFLIPKEVYKTQIEATATKALQRDVQLAGDVSISVFPRISASVQDVTVANAEGFDAQYMIEAGELRGSVKWLPLLSRRVDIQEIAFVDAKVDLQKLADGRANWELAAKDNSPTGDSNPSGGFDAGIASAKLENASLLFRDAQADSRYELNDVNLKASLQSLDQPLKAIGSGLFQGERFDIDFLLSSPNAATSGKPAALSATLESSLGNASYDGSLTLGDTPQLKGVFSADTDALTELAGFTGQEPPINLALLGKITATGDISGPIDALTITLDEATQKSTHASTRFSGIVSLGDAPSIDGDLTATLPQAGDFARQMGIEVPAGDALERLELASKLSGPFEALSLKDISATHTGALINATFNGAVSLAGDGSVTGTLSANSETLRALLKTADVELSPGETLQSFSTESRISGSFKKISLSDLSLALDDIKGTGTLGVDLTTDKPLLTGDLNMGHLDVSPFLGEKSPDDSKPAMGTGWSKTPLDLAGLSAVNADIHIQTDTLILGDIELTNATINAMLKDGQLLATLPTFQGFGGDWAGTVKVDSTRDLPAISFDMSGDNVAISSLLGTLSGFDKLTGTGVVAVQASAEGHSLDAIMNALDGKVSSRLKDGALKGLNVAQLVRSADSLKDVLSGGDLSDLDFGDVLSASAETDFTNFDTALTITDGVASIDIFELLNPVLGIDGTGQINLGKQKLDLRLATSIDKQASGTGSVIQLNGIPVPVRLSGDWTNLKITPDLDGVKSALKAELGGQLRDEISDRIGDKLGGDVGSILGDVLGVPRKKDVPADVTQETPASDAVSPDTSAPTPAPEAQPVDPRDTIENAAEQAAKDALGGLFGRRKSAPESKEAEANAPASNSEADTPADD